jgi:hypothetical protein
MMAQQLKVFSGKVNTGLKSTGEAAKSGASALYSTAMNNPKAATAVVLGTGVAAALIWAVSRNGTFQSVRKQVLGRVRKAPARTRKR